MISRRPRRVAALVCALAVALVVAACSSDDSSSPSPTTQAGPPSGLGQVEQLTLADVEGAVARFVPIAQKALSDTGVPGMAFSVVFDDQVVAAEGMGVRQVGNPEPVDAQTVFQLASVSKSIASTVVAAMVGEDIVAWDDPVVEADPSFALSDPWVTEHVTYADLFSHRSGLPEHAGDLLEDLGYDRAEVLRRLRFLPLDPFRDSYHYTNFGLTEAGVAAAGEAGLSWEDASAQKLYEPLGMSSTSSRFADYMARPNRAVPHVEEGDAWVARYQREPDAQSPAGGASSNVDDLARWMRLQLGEGSFEGRQVVDADALAETHLPHAFSTPPREYGGRSGFYGLGWNVNTDDSGRVVWGHSGAFALGAATSVELVPSESLGIAVLTNGAPIGLAETLTKTFVDLVLYGEPTRDWHALYSEAFYELAHPTPEVDYTRAPAQAAPARPLSAYVGTYANDFYGPLEVVERDGALVLRVGPRPDEFTLAHYDGDTFWFTPTGENAPNPSGVIFQVDSNTGATGVTVTWLDPYGMGTFTRT